MKLLILLHHRFELWNAPAWLAPRLRKEFPELDIVHLDDYAGAEPDLHDSEILIAWSLRPEQFRAATRLRWVHSPAAAVHQLIFPEFVASDIALTNARDVHGPVVAEHVIAQIFALAKRIPSAVKFQQRHIWGQEQMWDAFPRTREVAGATLGLVGLGSIGREVARRAYALGMHVVAVREHSDKAKPEGVDRVFPISEFDHVLEISDYVVLAVPLTSETRALMDATRLRKMQPGACLINVGRGPLIDEKALAEALRERKIGGAAIDVFGKEPLPADSPLWDLESLLITPHTAALTDKLWERHFCLIQENIARFISGRSLLGIVDKQKGY
ncbi:MAG TPA: D-2-hydroxyacid dehydrogenase [Terriglobales bacterium]|jgi:phosphoglycerate dehydrogenase-like enzyme